MCRNSGEWIEQSTQTLLLGVFTTHPNQERGELSRFLGLMWGLET